VVGESRLQLASVALDLDMAALYGGIELDEADRAG
jgi:hypothetical protein